MPPARATTTTIRITTTRTTTTRIRFWKRGCKPEEQRRRRHPRRDRMRLVRCTIWCSRCHSGEPVARDNHKEKHHYQQHCNYQHHYKDLKHATKRSNTCDNSVSIALVSMMPWRCDTFNGTSFYDGYNGNTYHSPQPPRQ